MIKKIKGNLATISCQVVSRSTLNLYDSSGKKTKASKSKGKIKIPSNQIIIPAFDF